ncbi:MAG: hypothetical protein IJT65_07805 [Eubacterium sp.]|nr:hypothetical protein [Eubacterium sp.]
MKKRVTKVLIALIAISAMFCIIAYGDNELPHVPLTPKTTTTTTEHTHNYQIVEFDGGIITFSCGLCGNSYTMAFSEHINDTDCPELDVVSDGIVNAKDYAYLMKTYSNGNNPGPWEGEEVTV